MKLRMIEISVLHGVPYIWDAGDWLKLRTENRIIGSFDGAAGAGGHTRVTMNLPQRLSKIETQFLIKNGIGKTVEKPSLCELKVPLTREEFANFTETRRKEYVDNYKAKRKLDIESMFDHIIEGKKRKGKDTNLLSREDFIEQEMKKVSNPIEITQIDLKDQWGSTKIDYDFPMPTSPIEILRYRVFEDFNMNKKYYLTSAIKFGGDFLAYPGDPKDYHAEFLIICQENDNPIGELQIYSLNRLAQAAHKTLVIAWFEKDTDDLKYKSYKNFS